MMSDKLKELLSGDPVVGVLTGAGISAESGVPTFRGENGLWKKLKPEELANFDAFMKNPDLVWEWYRHRQQLMLEVKPNRGHEALADFERRYSEFYLITQNIDDLHRRAGNENPIELHGNIMRNRCLECGDICFDKELSLKNGVPACSKCGGMLRPDVVWFGEMLPEEALRRTEEALQKAELFFSVGTSAVVLPAASIPVWAKDNGAYLVEINIEPTPLTPVADEFLQGKSGDILPALLNAVKNED